MKVQLELQWRS